MAPGKFLRADAARALKALSAHTTAMGLGAVVILDGYRPLGAPGDLAAGRWSQWAAWERYQRGGNLAARPGTSNHGLGIAIDVVLPGSRRLIDRAGAPYGWSKRWSDAPSEAWHVRFDPSRVTAQLDAAPVLRHGQHGARVEHLQRRLRALGFKSVPGPSTDGFGFFGQSTREAVRRFQKAHGLGADGVVGAATTRALVRATS